MRETFPILINYTQVCVYLLDRADADLLWTDEHVAQGFSWVPGNVAFGVPDHDGECWMEINIAANVSDVRAETSSWAIEVPFDVGTSEVRIGTLFNDKRFDLPRGPYRLIFEAHPGQTRNGIPYAYLLRVLLMSDHQQNFLILKQGELASGIVLATPKSPP